jgi:hypothetical protein
VIAASLLAPDVAGATPPGVNGSIAFQRHEGGTVHVMTVTPNGALARVIATGDNPAWSSGGTRLAFGGPSPTGHGEVFSVAADGSDPRQITSLGETADFAAWSPDDSKVAFAANTSMTGNYDIWVAEADGDNATNLTANPAEDIQPSWSPDGTKLAFQSNREGNHEIYVMNAAGGTATNLSQRPASGEESPDWSPDGSKIVFSSFAAGASEVFVMNADGTGLDQVTQHGGMHPTWSPDGQRIAFGTGPFYDIATIRVDGTEQRILTESGQDLLPTWQPVAASNVTTTTLEPSDASIVYGEDVAFEARVASSGATPTGAIQFRVAGTDEGAPLPLDAGGTAEFSAPYLLDVGDVVSATYGGDATLGWSVGEAALTVRPATTSTALSVSPNPVPTGGTVTVTVAVANHDTDILPFGSIQFSVDGAPLGDPLTLDDNGLLSVGFVADVAPGQYVVSADYVDDFGGPADFRPSNASTIVQVVGAGGAPPASPAPPPAGASGPNISDTVIRVRLERYGIRRAKDLRRRGFDAFTRTGPRFVAPTAGVLTEQYVARVPGASSARRVLVASGTRQFSVAGSGNVKPRLTRAGKRLVRRPGKLRVQLRVRFAPAGSPPPITITERATVRPRGQPR